MRAHLLKGFTIMELIVVVIIVGVMAGIAIPNFTRTIERARVQDATIQLTAIHAAQAIRFARLKTYWPTDAGVYDRAAINSNLNLNIIDNNLEYHCQGNGSGTAYSCWAARGTIYTVTVTQAALSSETGSENPECADGTTGTCP